MIRTTAVQQDECAPQAHRPHTRSNHHELWAAQTHQKVLVNFKVAVVVRQVGGAVQRREAPRVALVDLSAVVQQVVDLWGGGVGVWGGGARQVGRQQRRQRQRPRQQVVDLFGRGKELAGLRTGGSNSSSSRGGSGGMERQSLAPVEPPPGMRWPMPLPRCTTQTALR